MQIQEFAPQPKSLLIEREADRIEPILDAIGAIARRGKEILESGANQQQDLGMLMTRNHTLLQELQVSSPELDHLVEAAQQSGALGAKLSGGGMGGNMIALVNEADVERVSSALIQAGAVRIIHTIVGKN